MKREHYCALIRGLLHRRVAGERRRARGKHLPAGRKRETIPLRSPAHRMRQTLPPPYLSLLRSSTATSTTSNRTILYYKYYTIYISPPHAYITTTHTALLSLPPCAQALFPMYNLVSHARRALVLG